MVELKSPVVVASHKDAQRYSLKTYITGYILSVALTLTAYLLVKEHTFDRRALIAGVAVLAISQFIVQMLFFLHLGLETKPRWKLVVMGFMLGVILIIVFGSLWIMYNLNYRMTPQQVNHYLKSQDGGI